LGVFWVWFGVDWTGEQARTVPGVVTMLAWMMQGQASIVPSENKVDKMAKLDRAHATY